MAPGESVAPGMDHEPVPVAVPLPPALFVQVTEAIATLSEAVPPSVSVPLLVV